MKSKPMPAGKKAPPFAKAAPALTKAAEKVFPRGVVMTPKKGK